MLLHVLAIIIVIMREPHCYKDISSILYFGMVNVYISFLQQLIDVQYH